MFKRYEMCYNDMMKIISDVLYLPNTNNNCYIYKISLQGQTSWRRL